MTSPAAALPVGSETVRIGARLYSLEAIEGGFILDKEFGASYAVTRGDHGFSCDCGDARFRRNGLDSRGCKHLVKLRQMGLIPPVNHQEIPHMEMLAAHGLMPICGGSDEGESRPHKKGSLTRTIRRHADDAEKNDDGLRLRCLLRKLADHFDELAKASSQVIADRDAVGRGEADPGDIDETEHWARLRIALRNVKP